MNNNDSFFSKYGVSLIVAVLFFSFHCRINAQDIIVKSFELSLSDLSASTMSRLDENSIPCSLLKVATINKNVQFIGNVVGAVENKTNEYWVYLKSGSEKITISSPSFSQITILFSDYEIEPLLSKRTYNMTLVFKTPKDDVKPQLSYSECLIAAQSGSPSAIVNLGKCHLYGIGTNENPSEAARCFEKAAQTGNVEAIHLMGNSYFYGLGNPKNFEIAVDYYTKAAKLNYAPSLYSLGECYEFGKGVKQNVQKAKKFYTEAANKGYTKAQERIKKMME